MLALNLNPVMMLWQDFRVQHECTVHAQKPMCWILKSPAMAMNQVNYTGHALSADLLQSLNSNMDLLLCSVNNEIAFTPQ